MADGDTIHNNSPTPFLDAGAGAVLYWRFVCLVLRGWVTCSYIDEHL